MEGLLVDRAFLDDRASSALELTTVADLQEAGLAAPHIVQNILAASALARSLGVEPEAIHSALRSFRLDAHRIQIIARHGGITWVDDSKATNPHAAASSLRAYPGAVWVVGGDLKGVDIADLVATAGTTARAAVVIGVERAAVVAAFERHAPQVPVFEVDAGETGQVMNRVVEIAAGIVEDEGTVLLAPAAASFDQFSSYADRGHRFAEAVQDWIDRGAPMTQVERPHRSDQGSTGSGGLAARVSLGRRFTPVSTEFLMIASAALMLTIFGLVMVLSATSATAVSKGRTRWTALCVRGSSPSSACR